MMGSSLGLCAPTWAREIRKVLAQTPEDIALMMQASLNEQVREYGHLLEATLLRKRIKELEKKKETSKEFPSGDGE